MSSLPTASPSVPLGDEDLNHINDIRYFGLALVSLTALSLLACAAWVFGNRNVREFQVHQPAFLISICGGLFVWTVAGFSFSMDDKLLSVEGCTRACNANNWLYGLGFTITFSILYAKLCRINRLFANASRFQRVKVTAKDVLRPFLVLFTINFCLLLTLNIVDPFEWERKPISDDAPLNTFGACSTGVTGQIIASTIEGIAFVALILACIQAWKARNISAEFNEARYLGIGVANWVQIYLITMPTIFGLLGNENPSATYFLVISRHLAQIISMFLVLFVPLYFQVQVKQRGDDQRKNTRNSMVAYTLPTRGGVHVFGAPDAESPNPSSKSAANDAVRESLTERRNTSSSNTSDTQKRTMKRESLRKRNDELEQRIKELEKMLAGGCEPSPTMSGQ